MHYLDDPNIKGLCNGQCLQQILAVIVEPPTFWNAIKGAFHAHKLDQDATGALFWMTAELLSVPSSHRIDVMADAQAMVDEGSVFSSPSIKLRNLGHKVKYLLQMKSSATAVDSSLCTGRHDNDFPDFRSIAILPTSDEFGSTDKPFYRRAEEVMEMPGTQRVAAHIDNQFRLLREDMLSKLRESVQIAQKQKKGRRSALRLGGLSVVNLYSGQSDRRKFQPCILGLHFRSGLENFCGLRERDRKEFLKQNRNFLKHQSFGCLIRGVEIVAFATIIRDDDKLVMNTPELMLRITGHEVLKKALICMELYDDVDFLVVDSPIFAYEPILKCLQEKLDYPLIDDLFLYKREQPVSHSSLTPYYVVDYLKKKGDGNIQGILGTAKPVKLDTSQLESLLSGLMQKVSLIQGPPGMLIHSEKSCNHEAY